MKKLNVLKNIQAYFVLMLCYNSYVGGPLFWQLHSTVFHACTNMNETFKS